MAKGSRPYLRNRVVNSCEIGAGATDTTKRQAHEVSCYVPMTEAAVRIIRPLRQSVLVRYCGCQAHGAPLPVIGRSRPEGETLGTPNLHFTAVCAQIIARFQHIFASNTFMRGSDCFRRSDSSDCDNSCHVSGLAIYVLCLQSTDGQTLYQYAPASPPAVKLQRRATCGNRECCTTSVKLGNSAGHPSAA